MDKKLLLKGTCKYYRVGSKGDRYKMIIDDPELSDWIKKEIQDSIDAHNLDGNKPILNPQDFMRLKKIEVRLQ